MISLTNLTYLCISSLCAVSGKCLLGHIYFPLRYFANYGCYCACFIFKIIIICSPHIGRISLFSRSEIILASFEFCGMIISMCQLRGSHSLSLSFASLFPVYMFPYLESQWQLIIWQLNLLSLDVASAVNLSLWLG